MLPSLPSQKLVPAKQHIASNISPQLQAATSIKSSRYIKIRFLCLLYWGFSVVLKVVVWRLLLILDIIMHVLVIFDIFCGLMVLSVLRNMFHLTRLLAIQILGFAWLLNSAGFAKVQLWSPRATKLHNLCAAAPVQQASGSHRRPTSQQRKQRI